MTIPVPDLDDRTFQDIVDEAKRLIPRYTPEWTNHNVADPGVALIELFAWMSELVLFRLNQVPQNMFVHFLNLVGIEPFPPSVARADLTFWLSAVLEQPVVVPEGTEVATAVGADDGTGDPVVFTTTQDLVIAPPVLRAAHTTSGPEERSADVWDDLRFDGSAVTCFTGPTPGDACYFGFAESLAGLVVRLRVGARAEGIGVDPKNPPLAWEVWDGEVWVPAGVHSDTTGGLNRDGDVVLLIPAEHQPLTLAGEPAHWLRARLLTAVPGQPEYRVSPRIGSLAVEALGGTVPAEHAAVAAAETLGMSEGRPGQSFLVAHTPVLRRRAGEHVVVTVRGEGAAWTEVADFTESAATDKHVVWDADGTVRFGPRIRYPDGTARQHGAIPPDGATIAVTGYRHGGGVVGNVGARTLTVLRSTVPFVARVTNEAPASGGVDAESVEEAKRRGPLTLRTGMRAVTPGDFERLTREASIEVARARCLPSAASAGVVRVLVVPHVRSDPAHHRLDDFAISEPLLRRIAQHLESRRLVGTSIEVGTPFYQGVSAAALLRAYPGRPVALVRQRATDVIARYINPLSGGAEGTGWPFDTDVNTATLAQLLETVDGVERVEEVVLFEYDLRTGRRIGAGRDVLRLEPDSLFLSAGHQVVVR